MFDKVIIRLCMEGIIVINFSIVVKILKYLIISEVFFILILYEKFIKNKLKFVVRNNMFKIVKGFVVFVFLLIVKGLSKLFI